MTSKNAGRAILMTVLFLILLSAVTDDARADGNISDNNFRLDVGFTHWASDTFRKPEDGKDFSLGTGYRLPIHWLEVQGRYEWAHIKAAPYTPNFSEGDGKRVDFITAGIAFVADDFTYKSQRVILSYSFSALLVSVRGRSSGKIGLSSGPRIEWLFDGMQGIVFDIRKQGYTFPDNITTERQIDFTAEMGYVRRF